MDSGAASRTRASGGRRRRKGAVIKPQRIALDRQGAVRARAPMGSGNQGGTAGIQTRP